METLDFGRAPLISQPPIGSTIDDRFVVEAVLGSGGMAQVLAARHRELGLRVAVKIVLPSKRHSEAHRLRLIREARMAAALQSDHVVRVHDVVTTGRHSPYFVMECLTGETLASRLARGPLPAADAAAIIAQTCEGIGEAHHLGIVHRDLKPSNLYLVARPDRALFVKILDFGIAQARDTFAADLTQTGELVASPRYASPEQLRASDAIDERTDIWSLGVILYECVTGTLPFRGRSMSDLASAILRDPPRPVPPHVDRVLAEVIQRCLQKEPDQRFRTALELAATLHHLAPVDVRTALLYGGGLGETQATVPDAKLSSSSTLSLPPSFPDRPKRTLAVRSRRTLVLTLALAALPLLAALVSDRVEPATSALAAPEPPGPKNYAPAETPRATSLPPPVTPAVATPAGLPAPLAPETAGSVVRTSQRRRNSRAATPPETSGDVALAPLDELLDARK